ncbi:conserved hypothetical protein [Methanocaldococcus sp. FS406-22]|uniref:hypothetical protein n=1 Tax=Methanocaldococcus sp. (strain FS406-22) TaxID=644281 RepID=UPI0001BF4808|nr:hypothetical protein [Methanocaldococcus sp. FS406-22]ADC70044.1 conserved hypothetical protein [Methanocaldococcus sp. FS406-22]
MRGINPFYFYIVPIPLIIFIIVSITIFKSIFLPISIVFGSLLVITLILMHNQKKLLKVDKGTFKKEVKGKMGSWIYFIFGLVLILIFTYVAYFFRVPYANYLMFLILATGLVISELHRTLHIKIYEKGILIEGMAFCSWEEIEKVVDENKNITILKIKGIPKKITINEII